MSKSDRPPPDELRVEYASEDFKGAVRGKYANKAKLTHLVAIDADLVQAYPTAAAVNAALRTLLDARQADTEPE